MGGWNTRDTARVSWLTLTLTLLRSSAAKISVEEGKAFHVASVVKVCVGFMIFALMGLIGEFDSASYLDRLHKQMD